MTDRLRGELPELTKSAAMTAAARRIEALADRVRQEQTGHGETTGRATGEDERAEGEGRQEKARLKPRIPKPRVPKPHLRKTSDSHAATTGSGRRGVSDADESRE